MSLNGLKVDFFGCAMTGNNQISCLTKVVSTTNDQTIIAGRISSTGAPTSFLFDNLGRQYDASVSAFDTTTDKLTIRLIQGVPTEFIFNSCFWVTVAS